MGCCFGFFMNPYQITWEDTVEFVPHVNKGRCIKVYDGDTITIAARWPYCTSPLYRFSVRLAGIDAAELKDKSPLAFKAKEHLSSLILGKEVVLKNVKKEKYGRLLASVYYNNLDVNQWMLDQKLAVPYDGKTKNIDAFEEIKT